MSEEIPPLSELDWGDLRLYQHPPCMFSLLYVFTAINLAWDPVKDVIKQLLDMVGLGEGGGDDGGGGDEGEGGTEGGEEAGDEEAGDEEAGGEKEGGEEEGGEEAGGDEDEAEGEET